MSSSEPAIAIVGGTGALGFGLALRLAGQGVAVTIGSRDAVRAEEAARRARDQVPHGAIEGRENADAVTGATVVLLCVPFRSQSENLTNLKAVLQDGQLLIDTTVPLAAAVSGRATRVLGVPQGSAAQQAAEMAPEGVRVVSALHTVSAASLSDLDRELDEDVLVCGDERADKREAAALIDRIPGLRCVDCGRLEMARITESLTAMMISINGRYKTHAGLKVTGLQTRELWPTPSSS
ncbi:MAG: NADPH-dependent F420 reductase [Actinomycetota bacterium]|nr:NADPH-dependent F420 reductase [Actinomycetota bacterium]